MKPPDTDTAIAHRAAAHWEEAVARFLSTLNPRPPEEEIERRGQWLVAERDPHGKIGLRWFAWDGKIVMDGWWDLRRNDHIIRTQEDMDDATPEPVNPSLN